MKPVARKQGTHLVVATSHSSGLVHPGTNLSIALDRVVANKFLPLHLLVTRHARCTYLKNSSKLLHSEQGGHTVYGGHYPYSGLSLLFTTLCRWNRIRMLRLHGYLSHPLM